MRTGIAASLLATLALVVAPAAAQSNEQKLEKKLAENWINSPKWETDYDKAREEAKKSGKIILAYFTRSYAY